MIRGHVILAVFKRNFLAYFSSPTGYVFIAVFVALSAALLFWPPAFFTNNLANLKPLNDFFPYLLLFFVPAVAMGTWSEERKQGTEELLLTLPVRDLELVLGKFLAAQGIYTVALVFSLTNVFWLYHLGNPDFGLTFGNYLAYWFLGGALLAVAMVASLLTSSATVAFILGALFCQVPVSLGDSGAVIGGKAEGWLRTLGVEEFFRDFSSGVLTLNGLVYFAAFTVAMLYLNLALLGRRHVRTPALWGHLVLRAFSLVVVGIALTVLAGRTSARVDVTGENLHTLMKSTRDLLGRIPAERPVLIQAFVAPEVPENYVQTRETLLSMLRDFDAQGGDRVRLAVFDTEPFSKEAREAETRFKIKAVRPFDGGRDAERFPEGFFLGVAFTCGLEEAVIPFLYRGLSVEYELARSVGVVTGVKRKKVGIAATDAKVFGGADFAGGSFRQSPEWAILPELKKQYQVTQVQLDQPVSETFDALLVVMPSSLTQPQMDNLMAYVRTGAPVLLFDDPFPAFNPMLGANEPKPAGGRGGPFGGPPPSEPKGNIIKFLETVGIAWNPGTMVFDRYNPHPRHRGAPPEVVFVGTGNRNADALNPRDSITSGLQEVVLIFPGEVGPLLSVPVTYTPLLATSADQGGTLIYSEAIERGMEFIGRPPLPDPERQYRMTRRAHTLAARVQGTIPAAPSKDGKPATAAAQVNVLFCADVDILSNTFFEMNQMEDADLDFDNVTFVLNAVDVLAGDTGYLDVRKRRARHRTLERMDKMSKTHQETMESETKAAEEKAKDKLKEAEGRMKDAVKKLQERQGIDEARMEAELARLQRTEQAKYDAEKKTIDDDKKAATKLSQESYRQAVKNIQRQVKWMAMLSAPIPALLLAMVFLVRRIAVQRRPAA